MRKLIQYTGPFAANSTISVPAEYGTTYTHFGINYIKPKPSFFPVRDKKKHDIYYSTGDYRSVNRGYDIQVNQQNYVLNQNGVLEFDALEAISWEIKFLKDFPAETIIDIIIETE